MNSQETKGIFRFYRELWPRPRRLMLQTGLGQLDLEKLIVMSPNQIIMLVLLFLIWLDKDRTIPSVPVLYWILAYSAYTTVLFVLKGKTSSQFYHSFSFELVRTGVQFVFLGTLVFITSAESSPLWPVLLLPGLMILVYSQEHLPQSHRWGVLPHLLVIVVFIGISLISSLTRSISAFHLFINSGWLLLLSLVLYRLYDLRLSRAAYIRAKAEFRIASALASTIRFDSLVQQLVHEIRVTAESSSCSLYIWDNAQLLRLVASDPPQSDQFPKALHLGEGIAGQSAASQVVKRDASSETLAIPLNIRKHLFGVLYLTRAGSSSQDWAEDFLETGVKPILQFLERARQAKVFEDIESEANRSQNVMSSELLRLLLEVIPFSRAMLCEQIEDKYQVVISSNGEKTLDRVEQVLLDRLDRLNSPYRIADAQRTIFLTNTLDQTALKAWIIVPIKRSSGFSGALLVGSMNQDEYDDYDVQVVSEFANRLGLLAEKANLNNRSESFRVVQEALLDLVGETQMPLEELKNHILSIVSKLFPVQLTSLWLVETPSDVNSDIILQGLSGEGYGKKGFRLGSGQGIVGWATTERKPYLSSNLNLDVLWSTEAEAYSGFVPKNLLVLPLIVRQRALGAIELINKRAETFTGEDIGWLRMIAASVAVLLDAEEEHYAERLHQASRRLTREISNPNILTIIKEEAVQLLHGTSGGIYVYLKDVDQFRTVSSFDPIYQDSKFKASQGICGKVLQDRSIVRIRDYGQFPERLAQYEGAGIKSVIAAPLIYGQIFYGVVVVHRDAAGNEFTEIDEKMFDLYVRQAATVWHIFDTSSPSPVMLAATGNDIHYRFPAIMSVAHDGKVQHYTQAAQAILGYPKQDVVGQIVERFYKGGRSEARQINRLIQQHDGPSSQIAEVKKTDGSYEQIRLWGEPSRDGGSIAYFLPESEYQLALARFNITQWVVAQLPLLIQDMSIEKLLGDCLRSLMPSLGNPKNLLLYSYSDTKKQLSAPPISAGLAEPMQLTGKVPPSSVPALVMDRDEPLIIKDVTRDPRTCNSNFWRREKTGALAACPLRVDNEKIGVLIANFESAKDFQTWESQRYQEFADAFARAISCIQHVVSLHRALDTSQKRLGIVQKVTAASTPEQAVHAVLKGLGDYFAILGFEIEEKFLLRAYPSGRLSPWQIASGESYPTSCATKGEEHRKACQEALRDGRIRVIQGTEPACKDPACPFNQVSNLVLLPLVADEIRVGLVILTMSQAKQFDIDNASLAAELNAVSIPIAYQLRKLWFYDEVAGELDLVNSLAEEARAGKPELELVRLAAERIRDSLGSDCAVSIGLTNHTNPDSVEWTANASVGFPNRSEGFWQSQPTDSGLLSYALKSRAVIISEDCQFDIRCQGFKPAGMHAEMIAPLSSKGELQGAVDVYSVRPGAFSDPSKEILRLLIKQLQIALMYTRSEQRLRAEAGINRLSTVGSLLAHEVSTMSMIVESLLFNRKDADDTNSRALVQRISELANLFRTLAALGPQENIGPNVIEVETDLQEICKEYEENSLRILFQLPTSLPPVMAHGRVLRFMLRALLDNSVEAINKLPEGKITLIVEVKGNEWVQIDISDNAPGFELPIRHAIRYQGLLANPRPLTGHFGVTIYEVQRILEDWGGNLDTPREKSQKENEPKISLRLRVAPAGARIDSEEHTRLEDSFARKLEQFASKTSGLNVLIAEDVDEMRERYERILGGKGWRVWSARSVDQADSLMREQHIDVALVDVHLSEDKQAEGIQVMRRLRKLYPNAIIVLMSAFELGYQARSALAERQADAFWYKPDGEESLQVEILHPIELSAKSKR